MFSGERGIRTPGTSRYDGFQDRCNRPLYHLSNGCDVPASFLKVSAKVQNSFEKEIKKRRNRISIKHS